MEKEEDSKELNKVCDDLFLKGDSAFKGKVGIHELGSVLSLSDEEFELYIKNLDNNT